jgi:hypothetical protein
MAGARTKSGTYPLRLNKRESKVVETSVEQVKDDLDIENLGS